MNIIPKVIQRSNRKSLALTINEKGDLIVKAPFSMQLDDIFSYINQKQKWIITRQSKIKNILSKNNQLINYEKLMFLGKQYEVGLVKGSENTYLTDNSIIIKYSSSIKVIQRELRQFLLDNCESILIPRVVKIAKKMGHSYRQIQIINSKQKWGMCDNKQNLYFNYKLLMLPHDCIDYVIIHELCHLKQLNHSNKFWQLVQKYCPNYKNIKKIIKDANFLIKLF